MNAITLYKERLNLNDATFSLVDHDDAMVAIVYNITQPTGAKLILKICDRTNNYLREVYFLKHFADILPVPRIIQVVQPEIGINGAILMEHLPGSLLKRTDFTDEMAYDIGSLLARIHLHRVAGYGDLIQPDSLNFDPRVYFTLKFEEGFSECSNHLPNILMEKSRHYYDTHINFLTSVDDPCMIHRDFRPGNVIVHNGKLQGIIDWASGRASFAEEDFCPMEFGEWPINPARKKSFLAGYTSIRPVPDYNAILPLLQLSRAIATIGFTVKRGTWKSTHARIYQFNRQFLKNFFESL